MRRILAATAALPFTALAALANDPVNCDRFPNDPLCSGVVVPEISAMEGTAALAAVAIALIVVWERRRRAA